MNRLRSKTVWPGEGRVTYLAGASAEAVEVALESDPDDAPVVVVYYAEPAQTKSALVDFVLGALERGAARLFPAWLPGAEQLEGPGGAGVAAVRAMAMRRAATTGHFGPFLADLAEYALRGQGRGTTRFAPEVRALELSKVLAAAYERPAAAILIDVPEELNPPAVQVLTAAAQWFAAHGGFGVWLAGRAPSGDVERFEVELPAHVAVLADLPGPSPARGTVHFPPLRGMPRPDSQAETMLESALSRHPWAAGRRWNCRYDPLPQYVIDLMWLDDRCVVEVDGHEHRGRLKFELDRRRDVALQTEGFAVLRFTNDEVQSDVSDVVRRIEKFLHTRRINDERQP